MDPRRVRDPSLAEPRTPPSSWHSQKLPVIGTHRLWLVPFLGSQPPAREPPGYGLTARFPRKGASPPPWSSGSLSLPLRSGPGPGLYRLPPGGWDGAGGGLPGPLCEVSEAVREAGGELGFLHARNATVQQDWALQRGGECFLKGQEGRVLEGCHSPKGGLVWGWLPAPLPPATWSPSGLLSCPLAPLPAGDDLLPRQAPAASHPNDLRPQQDPLNSG